MKRKAQPINFDCDEQTRDALTSRDFGVHVVKNEHDGEEAIDLFIYGVVGGDWFDEEPLTAVSVAAFLAENKGVPVNTRINSPGGLVYDGITIYNALVAHDADVTTTIEGMAASAASIIAMAGDTIRIHENARLMIHRAWGLTMGNSADMQDYAQTLDRLDGQLAGTYAARTGLRKDTVAKLMIGESDGTSFDAAEAKAKGFADEIIPNKKKGKASIQDVADDAAVQASAERNGGPDAVVTTTARVDVVTTGTTCVDTLTTCVGTITHEQAKVMASEQAATREREGRARKLRLMEIDGNASQTPTG